MAASTGQQDPVREGVVLVTAPATGGPPGDQGTRAGLPAHLARDAVRRRMLAAADSAAVVGAAGFATLGGLSLAEAFWAVLLLPVWLLLAKLHGLYDRDHRTLRHLTADEVGSVLTWATVSTAVTIPLLAVTPAGGVSLSGAIRLWAALVVLTPILRGLARRLWRATTPPAAVLLVGPGPLEEATRRKLELFGDIHVRVGGRIDGSELVDAGGDLDRRIADAAGGEVPDRVIVCSQDVNEALLADLMGFCKRHRVKLSVVPPLRGMFGTAVRLGHVAELPFVEYHTWDPSVSTMTLKRGFDVIVALAALVLTAPLFVLVAIAIRLDGRGGVFFVQPRAGFHGEPFGMIKFRTMVAAGGERPGNVMELDGARAAALKRRDDPRTTRVGRVLRRWSLDELPQLVNVLRGEMSLVGPRPEELWIVAQYAPEHRFRLGAIPGMTGPMQVFGRGDLTFDERLAIEREYIENLSLGRDLQILLHTFPTIVSGRGAF